MIISKFLYQLIDKPISGEWGTEGGTVNVIRTANFTNQGIIDFSKVVTRNIEDKKIITKKLQEHDIIIEKSGGSPDQPVGRVVYFDKKGLFLCNNFTSILRPKQELIFPKYLHYILFGNHKFGFVKQFQNKTTGIINLQLPRYIKETKIPTPSLKEQKKIADILDAADSLRQKDKQLIEHYDLLSQSLFLDMFGDPVANPKQWNISSLKEAGKVSTGNTPPRANLANYGDHIEWIKTTNINTPNMYLTKAEEYLSIEGENIGRCVDVNSLLVTCIAGSKKVIGNVAIANRKVAFNQQINSFIPNSGNILFYYYLFVVGKAHVQTFSTDSMKGMINKSKFESIDFISPPIDKQNEFSEAVQLIQEQKELAQQALKKSEDLFNSLLQQAFKGKLTNS